MTQCTDSNEKYSLELGGLVQKDELQRAVKIKQVEEFLKLHASSLLSNPSFKGQVKLKLAGSPLPEREAQTDS